ncbi:MAG: ferritin-like domain-containing protein [Armatimonadota bacterium]|nr:ferritin-like domain-containing protein [bacterium]
MRMTSTKFNSLHDLFVQELKDLYDVEHQIIEALPKMIQAASAPEVKKNFEDHLNMTKEQANRLEEIFDMLDLNPEREHCDGIAGIIKDGEKIISADAPPDVKDAGLIAAAQKVEHYEISGYGTARTFARTMGHDDIAELLQKTLDQESHTDETLSEVAERGINIQAAGG